MAVCNATLPSAHADYCDPQAFFGQIERILFTRDDAGDDLSAVSAVAINARLDNTGALPSLGTPAPIRYLHVIGDMPEPEQAEVDISMGRKVYGTPKHTINFEVDDTGDVNHTLARAIQTAGAAQYKCWIITRGGRFYGGTTGFPATMKLNVTIPQSKDEIQKIVGTLVYEGVIPEVVASPI